MTDRICNGTSQSVAARIGRTLALVVAFGASCGVQAFEVDFNLQAGKGDDNEATSDVSFDFSRSLSGDNTLRTSGDSGSPTYGAALGSEARMNARLQAGRYAQTSVVALANRRVGLSDLTTPGTGELQGSQSGSQCWYQTGTGTIRICFAAFRASGLSAPRFANSALIQQAPRFALTSYSPLGNRKVGPDGATPANTLPQRFAMSMLMNRTGIAEVREPGTLGLVALVLIGLFAAHRRGLIGGAARKALVKA